MKRFFATHKLSWVTYIHNWPLHPFSQVLTPLMLCALILYDTEIKIFWETFSWQVYLLRVFARNLLRNWQKSPKKYFFSYFVLMPDLRHQPELYVYILSYIRQLQRPMISNYNRHSHFRIYESKWLKFICCVPE